MQEIMEFIYWLVEVEELPIAKALRQILVDKQKQLHFQQVINKNYLHTKLLLVRISELEESTLVI